MAIKEANEILEITPNETRVIDFDWSDNNDLATGETISSADSCSISPAGSLADSNLGTNGDYAIQVTLSGGTAETDYVVTVLGTTSNSQVIEGKVIVLCRN